MWVWRILTVLLNTAVQPLKLLPCLFEYVLPCRVTVLGEWLSGKWSCGDLRILLSVLRRGRSAGESLDPQAEEPWSNGLIKTLYRCVSDEGRVFHSSGQQWTAWQCLPSQLTSSIFRGSIECASGPQVCLDCLCLCPAASLAHLWMETNPPLLVIRHDLYSKGRSSWSLDYRGPRRWPMIPDMG